MAVSATAAIRASYSRNLLPLLIGLALAGCGAEPTAQVNDPTGTASQLPDKATPTDPAQQPATTEIHDKVGEIEFDYSWSQAAARIPALDRWLRTNGQHLRDRTLEKGRAEKASAAKDGYPFRGYTYEERWGVVADLPKVLVMQSEGYEFTGGAHGMPIVTTLIWDKAKRERLSIEALFDRKQLEDGLNDRFCAALDAERSKRRGAPVDKDNPDELSDFVRCVDLAKQTILPVSLNGQTLDTIRVVVMPYEAGPYAEGIYQLDLPVDDAVMRAVKPAYQKAFSQLQK